MNIEQQSLLDALYNGSTSEPRGVNKLDRGERLLGEWLTVDPLRYASVKRVSHIVLSVLRELPEEVTIGELIAELEAVQLNL